MGLRAADLTTSLQRNVIFRRLTQESPHAVDLLGNSAPPCAAMRQAVAAAARAIDLDELMTGHGYYPLGYPPLRQAVAAHLSARGLPTTQEQVLVTGGAQQAISLLAGRLALLEDLLHGLLPDWRWRRPHGGLSVWARLPAGGSTELAQIAVRRGVLVAPGPLMSPTGRFDEFIRLSFDHEPAVLQEGARRLASAWQSYSAELDSPGPSRMDVIVRRARDPG